MRRGRKRALREVRNAAVNWLAMCKQRLELEKEEDERDEDFIQSLEKDINDIAAALEVINAKL